MKFGKQFAGAQGPWAAHYLDYKALKQGLKTDCRNIDASGSAFAEIMQRELVKVVAFYSQQEGELVALLAHVEALPMATIHTALAGLRMRVQELTKFALLNYMAVIKSVKKRNRRLREQCGGVVTPLVAFDILQHQSFFTSRELSKVSVATSILEAKADQTLAKLDAHTGHCRSDLDLQCPVCLSVLRAPVVLTCSHAFCWSCITTYCMCVAQSGRGDAARIEGGAASPDAGKAAAAGAAAVPGDRVAPVLPMAISQLHEGWVPLLEASGKGRRFSCPVCRKQQVLDVDNLTVDANLTAFVEQQATRNADGGGAQCEADVAGPIAAVQGMEEALTATGAPLLPARHSRWHGKLSIVLDLDGTLVSSFPPRRAPRMPPGMRTHLVGKGSKLNPQGVFVVERPGLPDFLERAAALGELVVFTAGLADYALPIIRAIDPAGRFFGDRIVCRDGTTAAPEYPCVKDLSRLMRPLASTLIVDDTPLAFLWQPRNGVPVLGFRGDPDDNLLLDAVLPLLQLAAEAPDVRPFLDKRFGMAAWFASHGYDARPPPGGPCGAAAAVAAEPQRSAEAAAGPDVARAAIAAAIARRAASDGPRSGPLLLGDLARTLLDAECAHRVTEALAPELLPMLTALEPPADGVPVTNAVLQEMRSRGVTREQLLATLRTIAAQEAAPAFTDALRHAREAGATLQVLSNCNKVFVSAVLEGAGVSGLVHDVIANAAEFVRAESDARRDVVAAPVHAACLPAHKLAVRACHPAHSPHACPLCPASLCKGMHVHALVPYHRTIVFVGDGADDLCAVLCLREGDRALLRAGRACQALLEKRACTPAQQPRCSVTFWTHAEDLARLLINP